MKKGIYLFATAALMASCSQDEVIVDSLPEAEAGVPRVIGFDTFVDKATRAQGTNSTALNDFYPTFNVYGWKTVGSDVTCVFENISVEFFAEDTHGEVVYKDDTQKPSDEWTFEADNWYYENIRYWDKTASAYQFSAYTPAVAAGDINCSADGLITIGTATTPVTVDGKNLMATPADKLAFTGFATDYMIATSKVASSPVSLIFKHLQAKLNILIKLDEDVRTAQDVSVQKIQVHNLGDKAHYTNAADAVGTVSGWALTEGAADYVPQVATAYSLNDKTKNYNNHYVLEQLIIPQTIAKYTGEETNSLSEYAEACVYVEYTIGSEVFKSYTPLANIFSDAATYNLEGGKQYTINITVGPKPIYFTTEVTEWAEAVGKDLVMD